jgi:acyl-ACP thioesterase
MQEAAGNYAAHFGLSIERLHSEGVAWVLSRMRIMPERLPKVHETIEVTTWPVGVEGLQYRRNFIVRDDSGNVLLRAVSHWVVVSLAARKVGRVPAFIAEVALDNAETAMPDEKRRFPEVAGIHETAVFTARLSDIDRNLHVNNVRYMDWLFESVLAEVREKSILVDIDITYKAESYPGDIVSARTMENTEPSPAGESVFCHSLVRETDAKELVRAQSVWKRRTP